MSRAQTSERSTNATPFWYQKIATRNKKWLFDMGIPLYPRTARKSYDFEPFNPILGAWFDTMVPASDEAGATDFDLSQLHERFGYAKFSMGRDYTVPRFKAFIELYSQVISTAANRWMLPKEDPSRTRAFRMVHQFDRWIAQHPYAFTSR